MFKALLRLLSFSLFLIVGLWSNSILAQVPDSIYSGNIKTIQLYGSGDQLSPPIIKLNSGDQLDLHFDDLSGDVKYYYYTLELCNYDWTSANLSEFDYMKGFTQQRISIYRNSSVAYTRYTHYQVTVPDRNMMPTRSGNYLVKVFLDGDTSKLVFTRRMMVVDNKTIIKGQIMQPYNALAFRTFQKVQFSASMGSLDAFNASRQIKVVILQNNKWDNAIKNILPTFIRSNSLEYSNEENLLFPGGKEWRWLDIRDFHLQSDRVLRAEYNKQSTDIFVRPDIDRSSQKYVYYNDRNGKYTIENTIRLNPFWQGDYATVHFSYYPPDGMPYENKELYISGSLTDYKLSTKTKMIFNSDKKMYEGQLFLKEGYYDYGYTLVDQNKGKIEELDGNYFETENEYTILIYYRGFADRADQLIGISRLNSRADNPGFSF